MWCADWLQPAFGNQQPVFTMGDGTRYLVHKSGAFINLDKDRRPVKLRKKVRRIVRHANAAMLAYEGPTAQAARASQPIASQRVDRDRPMFDRPAPSLGGGAIDPLFGAALLGLGAAAAFGRRSRS